jgi:hypothetical protein
MRPTGNWSPALTERDVGFLLSPFFEDIVPLAPLPESPLPDSPLAPLPDMFKLSMRFYRLFVEARWYTVVVSAAVVKCSNGHSPFKCCRERGEGCYATTCVSRPLDFREPNMAFLNLYTWLHDVI